MMCCVGVSSVSVNGVGGEAAFVVGLQFGFRTASRYRDPVERALGRTPSLRRPLPALWVRFRFSTCTYVRCITFAVFRRSRHCVFLLFIVTCCVLNQPDKEYYSSGSSNLICFTIWVVVCVCICVCACVFVSWCVLLYWKWGEWFSFLRYRQACYPLSWLLNSFSFRFALAVFNISLWLSLSSDLPPY